MVQLNRDLLANFAGNGWVALMSFAFVPVYIRFLGIESYGLIGFFATFQALLSLLDMGLGSAINRELARLSALVSNAAEMRHLVRTLEIVYWVVAVLVAGIVALVAPVLASKWLQAGTLSPHEVEDAIVMLGFIVAARWPFVLYSGALMGLQRQVVLNGVKIGLETLRSFGAVLVLWLVSPTLTAFLAWQFGIAAAASLLIAWITWRTLPSANERPRIQLAQLKRIWKYAAGLSGIAITVVVLTQVDKLVLSKVLSLESFGYYVLAWAVAGGLGQLVIPVFSAYFPRFAQAVAQNDEGTIKELYHHGSQLMSLIILPVGAVLVIFSQEILLLWTRDPIVAEKTHLVLSIVVVGTVLNGLMNVPYALQLAYGWTSLALYSNVLAIVLLVPSVILLGQTFGPAGAATAWALLNAGYVLISLQIMHRRLLPGEKGAWYMQDVARALVISLVVAGVVKAFTHDAAVGSRTLLTLVSTVVVATGLCFLALPRLRSRYARL